MIQILTQCLIPIFVSLLLGYAAGIRGIVSNRNTKELVTFLMAFALPCALFVTILRTSAATLWAHGNIALVTALVYSLTFIITYYAAELCLSDTSNESAVIALTLGFPNLAGVGLPLLASLYGIKANIAVVICLAVGSMTITPMILVILESNAAHGEKRSRAEIICGATGQALLKPVFWAPMLGVVLVMLQLQIPAPVESGLNILGRATEGTALFVTGLVASAQRIRISPGLAGAVLIKSVLQPLLCLGVAYVFGIATDQTRYLVLLSAVPSGFFGLLIGAGYGVESEVASSSLLLTTVLSIVTLPVWIQLLQGAAQ